MTITRAALGCAAVSICLGTAVPSAGTAPGGRAGRTIVVQLKPRNGSGVSGTATLTAVAGHPRVVVTLRRPVRVRGSLPAHLHIGSCAVQPNFNVQSSLENVVGGRSTTVLRYTTWATLQARRYSIHVHAPGYRVISCGDVPRARG
jgi:hypothetical protein